MRLKPTKSNPNPNPNPKPTPKPDWPARTMIAAAMLFAACSGESPTTPTPTAAATPTTPTATATATASASASAATHVAITIASGNDVTVAVTDASGLVRDVSAGAPGDGASVEPYQVAVVNDDPTTLRVTWSGGPCDAAATLDVGPGARTLRLVEPECPGDAIAFDRVLVLRLSEAVEADSVEASLQDGVDTPG